MAQHARMTPPAAVGRRNDSRAADQWMEQRHAQHFGGRDRGFTGRGADRFLPTPRPAGAQAQRPLPERVSRASADGRTTLVGYLYRARRGCRRAARARGRDDAWPRRRLLVGRGRERRLRLPSTLSLRHKAWGEAWADAGYLALLVDGFGPRGYPQGFGRFSYEGRPAELNEVTVRPLDAAGALAFLRARPDVILGSHRPGVAGRTAAARCSPPCRRGRAGPAGPHAGRAASVPRWRSIPACGLHDAFKDTLLHPTAPTSGAARHGRRGGVVQALPRSSAQRQGRRGRGRTTSALSRRRAQLRFPRHQRAEERDANATATRDAVAVSPKFFAQHLGGMRAVTGQGGPRRPETFIGRTMPAPPCPRATASPRGHGAFRALAHPTGYCASVLGAKISSSFIRRGVSPCSSE